MPREGAYFCYCAYALRIWRYRKLPFISPGFIQVRKGFWVGLSTGGGGGGGLYPDGFISGRKRTFRNEQQHC